MEEQSSDSQDHYNIDEEDTAAKLGIYVDNNGEIMYNCDWEPTQEGLLGIASIFYKLLADDLAAQIFQEVKQQCVSTNTEQDFMAISSIIANSYEEDETKRSSDDEVVVPPDRIAGV